MSSVDYAELAGLNIALSNLLVNQKESNEESVVIDWIRRRIQQLNSKK